MIQAKELRIGNLINFHKIENGIQSISKCSIIQIINTPEYYSYIPLTEDWLIKFGFEKFKFEVNEKPQRTSYILFSKEMSDKSWLTIANSEMPISFPMIKDEHQKSNYILRNISHVHELQNLYFVLTNKELITEP